MDGDIDVEENKRTQCVWNNWRNVSDVQCDKRIPPHVMGKIHKMIDQTAILYEMETVVR